MVRGLGKLIRKGWKPLRTIVLASWDGEEYGLIGSTEWAEDFGSWLQDNAATYLNLDSSTSGSNFHGSASPSLARLLRGAAEDVAKGADASRSVWDARADGGDWDEYHGTVSAKTVDSGATGISPLGSGSDYTAFLMRYGIASTDFSFGGGPNDAVYHYHSIYDSHTWLAKYGDPGFHKHVEGAQIIGLIALRIADSLILPLNTTQYAHDLGGYLAKIEDLKNGDDKYASLDLARLGAAIEQLSASSAELDDTRADLLHQLHKVVSKTSYLDRVKHAFAHALGGCRPQRAAMPTWPAPEGTHAHAHAHGRARGDDDSAAGTTHTAAHATLSGNRKDIRKLLKKIRAVNLKLKGFEAGFISEEGITDREWYKHKGTSPGKWLGYGATTVSREREGSEKCKAAWWRGRGGEGRGRPLFISGFLVSSRQPRSDRACLPPTRNTEQWRAGRVGVGVRGRACGSQVKGLGQAARAPCAGLFPACTRNAPRSTPRALDESSRARVPEAPRHHPGPPPWRHRTPIAVVVSRSTL